MTSFLAEQAEETRQEQADDKKFYRNMKYIFELRVGDLAPLMYPLYLNPQTYTFGEPFTFSETPALYGGLIVEENGIIRRPILLEGVVGLRPSFYQGAFLAQNPDPTFKARGKPTAFSLSGPRQLQFLQDRVFRTYGDLKRNQDTAEKTSLRFHCLKDDDHWVVYPTEFELRRSSRRASMYEYRIQLVGVALAQYKDPLLKSPDKSVFDQIKDGVTTIRDGYNALAGAVKDVQRTIREVERFVNGVGQMLNDVTTFLDDVGNLLDAGASLISAPFNVVTTLVNSIEEKVERLIDAGFDAMDHIVASYNRMRDAVNTFAIHPRYFEERTRGTFINATPVSRYGLTVLETAANDTSAQTPSQFRNSSALSGDLDRARGNGTRSLGSSSTSAGFNGSAKPIFAQEYTVSSGDTIQNIATRLLGDSSRWLELASLNKLQSPYISETRLPNTVRSGDKILVPSNSNGTIQTLNNQIFGAMSSDSTDIQLYGRDIGLYKNEFGLYDMELTSDLKDAKSVAGTACLSQGLTMRVEVDRGTDQLYPNLGFLNVTGLRDASLATDMVESRFMEAVLADPRVRDITAVRISTPSPDQRAIDADVAVIGSSALVPVSAITSAI